MWKSTKTLTMMLPHVHTAALKLKSNGYLRGAGGGRIRRSGGAEEESGVTEDSGNRWTVVIRGGGWALW